MGHRIGPYEGSTRQGKRADHVREPRGVLTDEEACRVAGTLRRAPVRDDRVAMTRKAIREGIPLNRIEQELDWLDYLSETPRPGRETDRRSGSRHGVGRHGKPFRRVRNVSETPRRP